MTPERLAEIKRILGKGLSGFVDDLIAALEAAEAERDKAKQELVTTRDYSDACTRGARLTIAALEAERDALRMLIARSFATCVSGDGKPYVKIQFENLADAQDCYPHILEASK